MLVAGKSKSNLFPPVSDPPTPLANKTKTNKQKNPTKNQLSCDLTAYHLSFRCWKSEIPFHAFFIVIVLTVHFHTSFLLLQENTEVKCSESAIVSLSWSLTAELLSNPTVSQQQQEVGKRV